MRWTALHTHSLASDGQDSPQALWQTAYERKLHGIALTDHNTIEGYLSLRDRREEYAAAGCPLIPGVELTITDFGCYGHWTVLFPDALRAVIQGFCDLHQRDRIPSLFAGLPVLVLTGCQGSVLYRHAERHPERRLSVLADVLLSWQDRLRERLYLEVQPDFDQTESEALSQLTHIPRVATCDAHGTERLPLCTEAQMRGYHPRPLWHQAIDRSDAVAQHLDRVWRTPL